MSAKRGGLCLPGVCVCLPRGACLPGGVWQTPPVDRKTDVKHYLAATTLWTVTTPVPALATLWHRKDTTVICQ